MPNTVVTNPTSTTGFTIVPQGPFSLAEAATFGFGQRAVATFDGCMRLAFCVDGAAGPADHAAVEVRQDDDGVHCRMQGDADVDAVRVQVARVLSLDHDGRAFEEVGRRDPVIGRLQQVAPGLRPPLFYSPYEAAAWCVLSARRPAAQMAEVRRQLSERHGTRFSIAGQELAAFPTPEQLVGIAAFAGIPDIKLQRLHGVARAALDGWLDADRLRALGPDDGAAACQRLAGIGPFYASLIMIRATGLADVLPVGEPELLALMTRLYDLRRAPAPGEVAALAESWRPLRTWAAVLIRAAGPRLATA